MYGIEFGKCRECQKSTAISVNTISENGLWCMGCRVRDVEVREATRPIDLRIMELEQELQELYVTRAYFAERI